VELRREYSSGERKERQCDAVECVKEVERDSWASFKAKRSTAQVEQLWQARRRAWRLRRRRHDIEE
jgi:hypothetical protein